MLKKITTLAAIILVCVAARPAAGATLSPSLQKQLSILSDGAAAGLVIVSFNTDSGLRGSHLDVLRGLGLTRGVTMERLGMVAVPATAGQVRALAARPEVRSVWSNDRLHYFDQQARMLAGVERVRADRGFQSKNGGLAVSGQGDFSVLVIDSGVDATHEDLKLGRTVIQNVQVLTSGGVTLSDNGQIPAALRGYVQIAIDKGFLEVYPAEVRQTGPGQFQVLPGPRVEPANAVTRAALAVKTNAFAARFAAGN